MKRLGTYLIQGTLLIAPLAATIYILFLVFTITDGLLKQYLEEYFQLKIPGLGILILLLFLIFLGMIGETVFARPIRSIINRILDKTPLLRLVYSAMKDLFSAFVGKEKKFHRPVLVLVNEQENLWRMGFQTQETVSHLGFDEFSAVYFPFSYTFSGILYFVPTTRIKLLQISPTDAMKYIISGGISTIDNELIDPSISQNIS